MTTVKNMHLVKEVCDENFENVPRVPSRDGFGHALVELGKKNKDVLVLCGDLADSTRTGWFKKECPDQFIDVGIAEQNMLTIAAGLSMVGKIPFVSTYGVFCPGRCWDQIRISVCYNNSNVKFSGAHTGISVGPDGATHQALEDIALTRCLPNCVVLVPADSEQCKKATLASAKYVGPVYTRFGREKVPVITTPETPFEIGKAYVYHEGTDCTVVACGVMVYEALQAAADLKKEGISVEVINLPTVKPYDEETVVASAKKTGCVVTAEEHQVMGGMGSATAEVLGKNCPVPLRMVGVQDSFGESGQPEELMKKYGLTYDVIMEKVREAVKMKK